MATGCYGQTRVWMLSVLSDSWQQSVKTKTNRLKSPAELGTQKQQPWHEPIWRVEATNKNNKPDPLCSLEKYGGRWEDLSGRGERTKEAWGKTGWGWLIARLKREVKSTQTANKDARDATRERSSGMWVKNIISDWQDDAAAKNTMNK